MDIQHHQGKASIVADALSIKPYPTLNVIFVLPCELCEEMRRLELELIVKGKQVQLNALEVRSMLMEEI